MKRFLPLAGRVALATLLLPVSLSAAEPVDAGGVAALLDRAAAEPGRADEVAAALLLLDRNDDALDVLLAHRPGVEAIDLLASALRASEALALAEEIGDARARARLLASLGRDEEASALLASVGASRDGRLDPEAREALREASALGLRADALARALDASGSLPAARSRELLAVLWPSRTFEAEAAWTWLVRRGGGATTAEQALLRVEEILDPKASPRDAEQVLREATTLLASANDCEIDRIGAGLVGLAKLRDADAALEIARTWTGESGSAPAWMALGDELAGRSLWREAAAAHARAADAEPALAAARWMQGAMLRKAGDADAAARAFAAAKQGAQSSCQRLRLATAMEISGDLAEARALREAVLRAEPALSPAAARAANEMTRRHAALDPSVLAALADARSRAGSEKLSVARVLPLVRSAQAAELASFAASGDVEGALALAEHALDPFLANLDATASIVLALRSADRAADAETLLARVQDRIARAAGEHPGSVRLLNARAWLAARTGSDLAGGAKAAERAVELAPGNAGVIDTLAEIRFQMGDREGALEAARRALALEPSREYLKAQVARITGGDPASAPPVHLE